MDVFYCQEDEREGEKVEQGGILIDDREIEE